ncbi:MAG: FHA domain-containing protein [Pseudonocardiales bacterium]
MSTEFRVSVQAGDGIVARFGSTVLVADASTGFESFTQVVLDELDSSDTSASDLAWRVAKLLVDNRDAAPAFGLVIGLHNGYHLFLHGAVRAFVGDTEVSGSDALTWVDHKVSDPGVTLTLTLASSGAVPPDPRADLRGGLVPGSGLVLTPSGAHAVAFPPAPRPAAIPETAPEPPADVLEVSGPETGFVPSPSLDTMSGSMPLASNEPLPAPPADVPTPAVVPDVSPDVPEFAAVLAPSGETVALKESLTALIADDGSRTPLDRSYVFGREPQQDETVANGEASPIRLDDPEKLISRVQARLHVDEHGVTIQDAKSANGTFIAAQGATEWVRLGEGPAALPVGWSIRMGRRVFTHFSVGT